MDSLFEQRYCEREKGLIGLPETLTVVRADHVGSFLRPQRIKNARARFFNGDISKDELWEIENEEIEKIVAKQVESGLKVVTDGELRRAYFHLDFMWGCEGVKQVTANHGYIFHNNTESKPDTACVTGKLALGNHPVFREYEVLHEIAQCHGVEARVSVPAPSMFIMRLPHSAEPEYYATTQELFADLVPVYQDLIRGLYARGCRHLHFDDCTWSLFLQDNSETDVAGESLSGNILRAMGLDPAETLKLFVDTANAILSVKPNDMEIGMHVCRGNYKSEYAGSGSYRSVQETLFGGLHYDKLLLEFDDARSGDVDVLKYATRPNQVLVLGFITSKKPQLEDKEFIKSRIARATEYVPLSRLALSPQCGFASTEEGNLLTEEEQWRKIRHVVDIAEEVWGE